jgi:hypothetical protein
VGKVFEGWARVAVSPLSISFGLDLNHGAKGQVIFSRLSKQEGETFTSLSVPIADQA